MSFFYLTPVKGDLPLHLLETIVIKRLEFLKAVFKRQDLIYNEYVLEGSVYDSVGHYMLCIIFILERNTEFTHFFIKAEETLFKHRIKTLLAYDLRCFAKKLLRTIKKYQTNLYFLEPLSILCQQLILKHMVHHICSNKCSDDCSSYIIKVYFKHCLSFIAQREVELKQGIAYIPCSKWISYLIALFNINLKIRLCRTNSNSFKNDPRIADLRRKVRNQMITADTNHKINILRSCEVDNSLKNFPPCMLNLHHHLRKTHRLSHNQRFSYSLFLKDIGMPVNEAITFWRNEYEKTPNDKHKCCHNWKDDEKKFVYGIRHLYGLEGGRKSYTSGSCLRIQNSDTSCSEGGCPFKSFDDEAMLRVLDIEKTDPILSQIENLKKQHHFTSACVLYLKNTFQLSNEICDSSFSPVKYFFYASNII